MMRSGDPNPAFSPLPAVLMVYRSPDGKPQVVGAAWVGVVCSTPSVVSLTLRRSPARGLPPITGTFSVNLPREEILARPGLQDLLVGNDVDLLGALGLRLEKGLVSLGPVLAGCPIRIECHLLSIASRFGEETVTGEVLAMQMEGATYGIEKPVELCRLQAFMQRAQAAGVSVVPSSGPAGSAPTAGHSRH